MTTKKYYVGKLHERNGEYEYTHWFLFSTSNDPDHYMDQIAADFYGNECDEHDENGYYFNGYAVYVRPDEFKEVDKKLYQQLAAFMHELTITGAIETPESPEIDLAQQSELPVVVIEMNGGIINCVRSSVPMRVIFLDSDTEGGDGDRIKTVNGETVYVSDCTLSEQGEPGFDGINQDFVHAVCDELAKIEELEAAFTDTDLDHIPLND
ncbi:MAG: hypothetical protein KGI54_12295 [Pseudomonadota bacterium]|nr:hypothetical protein [Pseudomonadota bacterium]